MHLERELFLLRSASLRSGERGLYRVPFGRRLSRRCAVRKLDPNTPARSQCVQCLRDADCGGAAPVCDLSSNECTSRCQDSAQCSGGTPLCDPVAQVCVQCLANEDCAAPTPACDATTARCVECVVGDECPAGSVCNTESRSCVGCLETSQCLGELNAHCQTDPALPDPFTCVGCIENRDCSGKEGLGTLCRLDDGKCVECLTDAECTANPGASSCSPLGTCGACITDLDCAVIPGRPACLAGSGCVECTSNAQCSGNPRGPLCKTGAAAEPTDTAPVNTCVECVSDTDCTDPNASACQNDECVPCQANADCTHVDSTPGVAGGTPLNVCDAGSCVQCTGLQREACGANVCDSLAQICTNRPAGLARLCDDCVSDAECSPNARCVSLAFAESSIGNFCVPTPVDGSCASQRPFVGATSGTTLDSASTTALCVLRLTSCPGLNSQTNACAIDEDCGAPGVADGVCVAIGGGTACSTFCMNANDCTGACESLPGGDGVCAL